MNENNTEEKRFFSCPRCGNEVNMESRYCMKCGYMNPSHPENEQFKKYMNTKEGYTVDNSGNTTTSEPVNVNEAKGSVVSTVFGDHMGSFTLCFVINLLTYLIVIGLTTYFFYYESYGDINTMLSSELSYVLIIFTIVGIYMYSIQLVYMKMNRHWWASLVPFVNLYSMSDAIYHKMWLNILIFVPVIGQIYLLVLLYKMGKEFKVSGFLTLLFPFIMYPVLGFGGQSFRRVLYVSGRDSLEKEYRQKKSYLILAAVVLISSVVMIIYSNTVEINRGMDRISSYYLYYASQRVITRTKLKVENKVYTCDTYGDTFYFHFSDLSDYFSIPFYVYRDPIEAYVKVVRVVNEGGITSHYEYYISMTDQRYGYAETPVDEVSIESITEYKELDPVYSTGHQCFFSRNG